MALRPKDVNDQTFRVTFRGFDPVEVDAFLKRVADELERLADERSNLELELDVERASRKSLEETLEATSHIHTIVLEKAKEEARLIVERARLEADKAKERARDELAEIHRQVAVARDRRANSLAQLGALAHGLNDWIARFEREFDAGSGQTAFTRRLDRLSTEAAESESEELQKAQAPVTASSRMTDPVLFALEAAADDSNRSSFVLTDQRSDMLMDIIHEPDAYTPPNRRGADAPTSAWVTSNIERVGEVKVADDGGGEILIPSPDAPIEGDLPIPSRRPTLAAEQEETFALAPNGKKAATDAYTPTPAAEGEKGGEGEEHIEIIEDFTGEES